MTDKITLIDLVNLQNETTAVNAINSNNATLIAAYDNTLSRDGSSPNQMNATLDMNSNHIINLPAPVAQTEPLRLADVTQITQFQNSVDLAAALAAATTSATNAAASNVSAAAHDVSAATSATSAAASASAINTAIARIARLATTTNITLSGLQTIDGVTTLANDRVLVKNQTVASQNGLYMAASGAWSRASNFNAAPPIQNGAVVNVIAGATQTGDWVLSSVDTTIVLGTSLLVFTQSSTLNTDVTTSAFQQDGPGTSAIPVVKILKQWNTLTMYGGGPDKTAAQNASAFAAARDAMIIPGSGGGGILFIPPGVYTCDPVVFPRTDAFNGMVTIEGVANVAGGIGTNSLIQSTATGSTTFWNFDSPATGLNNGTGWHLKNLYLSGQSNTYTGSLVSSTTSVTDGSKITSLFYMENCMLVGGNSCTLLNIGRNIVSEVARCSFSGGSTQILGQQGLTVAGIAQARQSTTFTLRKNSFIGCNGTPILYGGEGWGLYDNIFEASAGGRGRAFATNSNYPINNMTWINNWFGDLSVAGDQWIVIFGCGFNFIGNVVGGAWSGSGPGSEGINLNSTKGFNIDGNSFEALSVGVSSSGTTNNFGSIRNNVLLQGTGAAASITSLWGADVDISNNGAYP